MAVQHGEITNPSHIHECKQILSSDTVDAGKVITPSGGGKAILRRLKYSEIDDVPPEVVGRDVRVVSNNTQQTIGEGSTDVMLFVTASSGVVVLGEDVPEGTVITLIKMDAGASCEVIGMTVATWLAESVYELDESDVVHTELVVVRASSDTLVGYKTPQVLGG